MRPSLIATSALVLALGAGSLAGAQSTPAPVPTPIAVPTLPPNTPNSAIIQTIIGVGQQILQRQAVNSRNNARGTVSYFKRFDMQVQCGTNCYRTVKLHQGTVINPRGATPGVGAVVDVNGRTDPDGTLQADNITVQQ
ncbi:MAG: hypothetical protein QOJ39_4092 [Candidatus Eremiobacteraeota bacterium]|jgi:hypothetical protein|nr:hypothetical protein [Candidatus Eremiobacteraeota bacterium]MEA2722228.1 hypothetical protein [Candidatus Eremiobacteraeota bacterium]